MKKLLAVLVVLLALCAGQAALADVAANITKECRFKVSYTRFKYTQMTDGKYTTYWESHKDYNPNVAITAPQGKQIHGLYLCFSIMPDSYEIQVKQDGKWTACCQGDTNYYHMYYPLEGGVDEVRVYANCREKTVLGFNELTVLGEGEVPDWVQRWNAPVEKADILFMATHPDDELLFFCGAVPTYVLERKASVAVAYLTSSNKTRRAELLNGLWAMGVRNYPIIGDFGDNYAKNLEAAYKNGGGTAKVLGWIVEVIRSVKPEVIVTQAENGEYGHKQHVMLADGVKQAFDLAAKADIGKSFKSSQDQYGVWQAKKLYLHDYGKNQISFDWTVPLAAAGGKSSLELAQAAYAMHITQKPAGFTMSEKGVRYKGVTYDNHTYGLYKTLVGEDEAKNDFLEHVDTVPVAEPVEESAEEPVEETVDELVEEPAEEPVDEPADEPVEEPAEEPVEETVDEPVEEPTEEPVDEPADEEPVEESAAEPAQKPAADASGWGLEAEGLPALNAKGFLDEGEFVLADDTNGLYLFANQDTRVVIERKYDAVKPMTWYEAEIWSDVAAGGYPKLFQTNPQRIGRNPMDPAKNATKNKVVFAMNSDYYTYRIGGVRRVGVIIREGKKIFDDYYRTEASRARLFPNMDTMSIYPDGHVEVWHSEEKKAADFLQAGAETVLSFGPYLIKDGVMNEQMLEPRSNKSRQPRTAFGMVEPGHYVSILAEGRVARSTGITLHELADLMVEKGCTQALNLDGGQTAVVIFMGKTLNLIGSYDGKSGARHTTEVLGFGTSEQVGQVQFK